MTKEIKKIVVVNALPSVVWEFLTAPNLMKNWMGEPEMSIQADTNWEVGSPILIKGFHHVNFENKGRVLQFDPYKTIRYTHLSSLSRLPDTAENYSVITFLLTPSEKQTVLTLKVENFPTESIYRHLNFYWQGTTALLKNVIEQQ